MASVAEIWKAVFLAALVIVLLDSTTIGGILLQCIVVSDIKATFKGRSRLFAEAGGNWESLPRCECGEDLWKALEEMDFRIQALVVPGSKLAELNLKVDQLNLRVHQLEISVNNVEVLKNDVTSIQKDIQTLKHGLNEGQSNSLPPVPLPSLEEVIKKVDAEENNIPRLKTEVAKVESDRGDLRESFERMKREVAKERSETNLTVASIRARIDSLDRAGQRVIGILRASKSFSDNFTINQKDVAKAQEVPPSVPQRKEDQIEVESTKFMMDSAGLPRERIRGNISRPNATEKYATGTATANGDSAALNTSQVLSEGEESQRPFGEDVKEIEFVGSDGSFSFTLSGDEVVACTEYESTNVSLSPAVSAPCSSFLNNTEHASVGSSESATLTPQGSPYTEWPLEGAMSLLTEQFLDLQKSMAASRLDDKVAGLEQHAAKVDASLSNLGHLVSACEGNVTRAFSELIEEILQTFGAQEFTNVKNHSENLQNSVGVFRDSIKSVLVKFKGMELDLASFTENFTASHEAFRQEQKDNVGSIESWLLTLNDSVASGATEMRSKFEGINHLLDTRISELDRRFQEAASLTVRLNETLTHLNINVRKLTQDYNSSIANTDLSLREKISELERAFTGEIEHVNQMVQNMTNVAEQLPLFYGWHPDDSEGCQGLKLLATDEHVVLSTELGRFRVPNLPTDLLPTDSVVRFRCSPAGSHRLVGAEELRCLGGGRWSHRPPVCQPLPTLEQLLIADKGSVTVPSIHNDGVLEEDEWTCTDDDGNLVVRPGAKMRLTCLYPRSKGDVVWLHNGRGVPKDAIISWASEAKLRGFAYRMSIDAATPKHSGEYSCQAPDGKRHSVKIKVAEVECERLKAPLNGLVVPNTSGRVRVGSRARFSCHLGHHLVGRQEVICLGNGRWSDLVPTCEEIENFVPPEGACPRPSIPPGMVVLPDQKWYYKNSKVNYSCDGGRHLVGMPTAACHSGTWMGVNRKCV
ncbi:uncharacterized protein LOC144159406 isoform X1 [Haemaphysalis longicornis]